MLMLILQSLSHHQVMPSRAECPCSMERSPCLFLPAVPLQLLGLISAIEELPLEELHSNDSKYEHEEHVDDEDIEDILQGVHHTVKHGLQGRAGCEASRDLQGLLTHNS